MAFCLVPGAASRSTLRMVFIPSEGIPSRAFKARDRHKWVNEELSQEKVLSICTALPPLSEQRQFAERAMAIASLRNSHKTALTESEMLFASLQHRAFRGDL